MTGAFDQLQAGIRQGRRQPAARSDGNQPVRWVGEQEYRRLDRRDRGHQLV